MNEQAIRINEQEEIIEVAFFLCNAGTCCVDVAVVEGKRGQTRHEVVQFAWDSEGATSFARNLMDDIWPKGWYFSEHRSYSNGISWCHVEADMREEDIENQRSWLYRFVPDLTIHSITDESNQEYEVCEATVGGGDFTSDTNSATGMRWRFSPD